ncbi:MAG: hypothetical protein WC058_14410 [Phycisphaeraceae bacterium]
MPWLDLLWDHEPGGNVEHIAENHVTPDEVREVLESDLAMTYTSRRSADPSRWG